MRILLALAMVIGTASAALADTAPVLVIPGRPGVPIIINGVDASYAVIEGDWGLAKGEHFTPVIYGGRYLDSTPNVGHYYPSAGYQPGYGRLEIEPPASRRLPQPAQRRDVNAARRIAHTVCQIDLAGLVEIAISKSGVA